jgi:putative addiction module component (TIGR02574 family)
MPHTLDEIRQIALKLPEEDRRRLANTLWESIESESESDEAWKVEVERRIDAIASGTVTWIPEETVQREFIDLRSQLNQRS